MTVNQRRNSAARKAICGLALAVALAFGPAVSASAVVGIAPPENGGGGYNGSVGGWPIKCIKYCVKR